jgi:hypothetical protein
MIRSRSLCLLGLVLALAVSFSFAETPPRAADKKESPAPEKSLRERMRENQKKLNASIDFVGIEDPKTTLDEILKDLGKRYEIFFDINERAFEAEGLKDVKSTPLVSEGMPIPPMKGVSLDYVLRKILSRIPVASGATYMNRGESIEITSPQFRFAEIHPDPDRPGRLPLAHVTLDKQSLEDALKKLADHSSFNIVLDARCSEKARILVTADLANVPIDTAVRLLAEMAELKVVLVDNVLFVTTKESAKELHEEYRRRRNYDIEMETAESVAEAINPFRFGFPKGISEDQLRAIEKLIALQAEKKATKEMIESRIRQLEIQIEDLKAELRKQKKK